MTKTPCVLVCVTQQSGSERLIKAGKAIAQRNGLDINVINVQPANASYAPNPEMMEKLHQCCKQAEAQLTVYFNDSPELVAASYARKCNAVDIVTGFPGANSSEFVASIHMLLPDVTISMVDENLTIYNMTPQQKEMGVLINNINI
ncbi:MAG: hypothetical protein K5917_05265 [Clostridiales bacterium]|nr:hypothetical protein [Clostridiales bacterium]